MPNDFPAVRDNPEWHCWYARFDRAAPSFSPLLKRYLAGVATAPETTADWLILLAEALTEASNGAALEGLLVPAAAWNALADVVHEALAERTEVAA